MPSDRGGYSGMDAEAVRRSGGSPRARCEPAVSPGHGAGDSVVRPATLPVNPGRRADRDWG